MKSETIFKMSSSELKIFLTLKSEYSRMKYQFMYLNYSPVDHIIYCNFKNALGVIFVQSFFWRAYLSNREQASSIEVFAVASVRDLTGH